VTCSVRRTARTTGGATLETLLQPAHAWPPQLDRVQWRINAASIQPGTRRAREFFLVRSCVPFTGLSFDSSSFGTNYGFVCRTRPTIHLLTMLLL
jgi:hypothetical protein